MRYDTTILQIGNNTGIEVPPAVIEGLGGGKKPAVVITIGSFSYRSSVAVMGGKFLISLSAERRAASGLKGGDLIQVDLQLDTAPREVVVPDDPAAAWSVNPRPRPSSTPCPIPTSPGMSCRLLMPRRPRRGSAGWRRQWRCCGQGRSKTTLVRRSRLPAVGRSVPSRAAGRVAA